MVYKEEEYLQLSGIQHFAFCRRQWALIHVESQWKDNLHTTEGNILHERAHDISIREKRNNIISMRNLSVSSAILGISGQCDIVEYHKVENDGITLAGYDGIWRPFPIEYKRGSPKETNVDKLQLCAQAMCLEEMLCCGISEGALYYGETRHREEVPLSEELRSEVKQMTEEMHSMLAKGHTPKAKITKSCKACSLNDICVPELSKTSTVATYIRNVLEDEE